MSQKCRDCGIYFIRVASHTPHCFARRDRLEKERQIREDRIRQEQREHDIKVLSVKKEEEKKEVQPSKKFIIDTSLSSVYIPPRQMPVELFDRLNANLDTCISFEGLCLNMKIFNTTHYQTLSDFNLSEQTTFIHLFKIGIVQRFSDFFDYLLNRFWRRYVATYELVGPMGLIWMFNQELTQEEQYMSRVVASIGLKQIAIPQLRSKLQLIVNNPDGGCLSKSQDNQKYLAFIAQKVCPEASSYLGQLLQLQN